MRLTEPPDELWADGLRLEAVLRLHETLLSGARPAVAVARLSHPAVSYGVSVPEDAAYLRRARSAGLEVGRRRSGGTGLVHEAGDLEWAVILPRTSPAVGRDFVSAYGRLGAGAVRALRARGIPSDWRPAPGISEEYCPLSARGSVLVAEERIVGAAAQHITGRALLHHGSISLSLDRVRIAELFGLPPGPVGRLGAVDVGADPAEFGTELLRALAAESRERGGL